MGEGKELYEKAVEAGDMSIYTKGAKIIEDKVIDADAKKFFSGDEDAARVITRKRQQFQANQDNAEYDVIKKNLERPPSEVYSEALAVENIANKLSLVERGVNTKPAKEDYEHGQAIIDNIGVRESQVKTSIQDGLGATQQEIIERNATESEQRTILGEDLKELILEVARSNFSVFFEQYRNAKALEKKSKASTGMLISTEITAFRNDFQKSVLNDARLITAINNDGSLREAANVWAARFYEKELNDYLDRRMSADNYSI